MVVKIPWQRPQREKGARWSRTAEHFFWVNVYVGRKVKESEVRKDCCALSLDKPALSPPIIMQVNFLTFLGRAKPCLTLKYCERYKVGLVIPVMRTKAVCMSESLLYLPNCRNSLWNYITFDRFAYSTPLIIPLKNFWGLRKFVVLANLEEYMLTFGKADLLHLLLLDGLTIALHDFNLCKSYFSIISNSFLYDIFDDTNSFLNHKNWNRSSMTVNYFSSLPKAYMWYLHKNQ